MADIKKWIDNSRARATRAADHVANVAAGVENWTMKVPATDTDTDVMLIDLLEDTLGQALDAVQAVLDMHHDRGDGVCYECSVGTLVDHPCPTVRTIQDTIKEM